MWQVRWIAAELILKMSDTGQIDEFMQQLGHAEGMALAEPLIYGQRLAEMKGPKNPEQIAAEYAEPGHPVQARLTALAYYYRVGTKQDLPKVQRFATDKQKAPQCKEGARDCEWKCEYQTETKDVKTVGDFVNYCVVPAMEKRAPTDKLKQEKTAPSPK
jgi:hypothetical protein